MIRGSYKVEINRDLCIKCLNCYRICPLKVFEEKNKKPYVVYDERCSGCHLCEYSCPTQAVAVKPTEPEEFRKSLWNYQTVEEIRYKAHKGKHTLRSFGVNRKLPGFYDLSFVPGQLFKAPSDPYREECNTKVSIKGQAKKSLDLDVPLMIGAMSYGALSKEVKMVLASAASNVGICANSGEGGSFPEERKRAKKLVVQFSSGRFGVSVDYLRMADAIEIKLGQGAKPGMGGVLLGEKVTEEISKVRGIPKGIDALSPAKFLDTDKPEDFENIITMLREATDYEKPIIVKLGPGNVREDVQLAAMSGADAIAIDGMEGGTGASPEVATEFVGIPTLGIIRPAVETLEELDLRGEVKLIILGGIIGGADVAKALALGADVVGMGSAMLVSIGCTVCQQCHLGKCPVGIATQDPVLRKRLNVEKAVKHATNFLNVTVEELKMLTQLSGHTDINELSPDDLRALNSNTARITGTKLIGSENYVE